MHSLYAAVSLGLVPKDIIDFLDRLSKTPLPQEIREWILRSTQAFGRVKLVLKHNRYFLETPDAKVLQKLMQDEVIGAQRIEGSEGIITEKAPKLGGVVIPGTKDAAGVKQQPDQQNQERPSLDNQDGMTKEDDMFMTLRDEDDDEDDDDDRHIHSFEVPAKGVESVQKRCLELGFPVLEEYDFKNDRLNPNLDIDLKPNTLIRQYQEKSLGKMFSNGRARSGIIVLPCGAGKTLVGITAGCTIKKGVVVLCTSSMSVVQWRNEFLKWSNISPNDIAIFTSDHKEKFSRSTGIIVSTYSMVTQTRSRSYDAQKMMDFLQSREWGLMVISPALPRISILANTLSDSGRSRSALGVITPCKSLLISTLGSRCSRKHFSKGDVVGEISPSNRNSKGY